MKTMEGAVLVGYSATPEGDAALARGIEEARVRGAPLHVLRSIRGATRGAFRQHEDFARRTAEFRVQLEEAGIPHEFHEAMRGRSPEEDILAYAEDLGAQLIVIGLRRRSAVGKLVLGSSAQSVLLGADCPVLAVKVHAAPGETPTSDPSPDVDPSREEPL
jgi:nucleotide-binding universal stress UspA family protein